MKKVMKKAVMTITVFVASYIVFGNLLHRYIFPEKKPLISTWFKPGQKIYSKTEGFLQTVIKQENGYVHCSTIIEPFADGPPMHIHTEFDETFQVENGELSVWVDGSVKKLKPGEVLNVPKGIPHKPYNETADTIHIKGSIAFPEKFAFYLNQVYALMDSFPGFMQSSKAMIQMPFFQSSGFDAYTVDGPPVAIQKASGFIFPPMMRLFGYKSYYEKYDPFIQGKK